VTLLRADSFSFSASGKDLHLPPSGALGDEMNWKEAPVTPGLRRFGNLSFTHPRTDTARASSSAAARRPRTRLGRRRLARLVRQLHLISKANSTTSCAPPAASARCNRNACRRRRVRDGHAHPLRVDKGKGEVSRRFHRWARRAGLQQAESRAGHPQQLGRRLLQFR